MEEEEDEMVDLVKRATNATPEVVGEADQHPTSGGSEGQAIVVMDSPKMGFHG